MSGTAARLAAYVADRYTLERSLGAGAAGEVFLARDLRSGASVALKVLSEHHDDGTMSARFRREIEICRRLAHPGIVGVVDAGSAGDALYYAMPYVEGRSLRDRLDVEGALPVEDALRIAREIAQALAYAHERGVVHRDVKPENVLLTRGADGIERAVLTDFGIALATDATGARLTRTGMAVGTPLYMCPEQAFGEGDARSDQYSLACVVYEMLVGEPPFTAGSLAALLARHAASPPPSLRAVRASIPDQVNRTVLRALAKVPADRFTTCADFAAALALHPSTGAAHQIERTPPRSVGVLPLVNDSGEPAHEHLCDGIAEELITALSRVRGLRVLPRASSFALRGRTLDLAEAGRRLGVTALLTGSLRAAGDRLRVNVALSGTRDGFQLWAARFDGTLDDVFSFEDRIAAGVVDALELHLSLPAAAAPHAVPTRDAAAHDAFLRGRHLWARRTGESLARAADATREAVARDPEFAQAHASLALVHATQGVYGTAAPSAVMPLARGAAERAIALDPRNGEALAALGCVQAVYDWNWSAAEQTFRGAITATAGLPVLHHWYAAQVLLPLGRVDEAQSALRRARAIDPLSTAVGVTIGLAHAMAGELDAALDVFAQVRAVDEAFAMEPFFAGLALLEAGRADDALAPLTRAAQLGGGSAESLALLAQARAATGDVSGARALAAQLAIASQERYVSPALLAQVHAALGERDAAFRLIESAIEVRAAELVWVGKRAGYDPLRGDPRWHAVETRVLGAGAAA